MSLYATIRRETFFMSKDKALLAGLIVIAALSSMSIWFGIAEVRQQEQTISQLISIDRDEREVVLSGLHDFGGAAFYSFHLTYDPPSNFAVAALGQRDNAPWKHRIRMLALEGQIYERDVSNPLFALIGRFDFAFMATFVYPLILIILLHDLRSGERAAGRYGLLVATAGHASRLWWSRACLCTAVAFIALIIPLLLGSWVSGVAPGPLLSAMAGVFLYTIFWMLLCFWLGKWQQPSATILAMLMGVWAVLAVILPTGGAVVIERMLPVPSGGDIVMTQREAVNDAWDLPKEETMNAFLERHPEWSEQSAIQRPFEWKWYYAFQQVGDQRAEPLSIDYRDGRLRRDMIASRVALFAPPALLERTLQSLAETDVQAAMAYEKRVRKFHAQLRSFYYPLLFSGKPFSATELKRLPQFEETRF